MCRTAIYVDGFNLYYGALKGTPHRWLDLEAAFEKVLQRHNRITRIKYFTALVDARIDPDGQKRQKLYLKALQAHTPSIRIHYGHFLAHTTRMKNAAPPPAFCNVIKTEEKGSDVNLAAHFIKDAFLDRYDAGVIVSNDGDLVEALNIVRHDVGKLTGVILPLRPGRTASQLLTKAPNFVRSLRPRTVASAQLPETIPYTSLTRPRHWQ